MMSASDDTSSTESRTLLKGLCERGVGLSLLQRLLEEDRGRLTAMLKALDFATIGQRSRIVQALKSPGLVDEYHPPPTIVTLGCVVDGESRRLTVRISEAWQRQPLGKLLVHFAKQRLSDFPESIEDRLCLRAVERSRALLENTAFICDALVDRCFYAVAVVPPPRDDFADGNPYHLPLEDEATREALKRRDPRDLCQLDTTPPPRFAVEDVAAYDYLEEHGYVVIADAIGGAIFRYGFLIADAHAAEPSGYNDSSQGSSLDNADD